MKTNHPPMCLAALVAAGLAVTASGLSGQRSQEELKRRAAAKLAKPFLENADWILSYDDARARAKTDGKMILTYFTRTYSP